MSNNSSAVMAKNYMHAALSLSLVVLTYKHHRRQIPCIVIHNTAEKRLICRAIEPFASAFIDGFLRQPLKKIPADNLGDFCW